MTLYYPVFLVLKDKLCVVIGGGSVGFRKAEAALEAGARVRVVAPDINADLRQLAAKHPLELREEMFDDQHLAGATLAYAATDSARVNHQVLEAARRQGILVNMADSPDSGDFVTAATVRRGDLCLAITTGSASPKLTARIRRDLEKQFSEDFGEYIDLLGVARTRIKELTGDIGARGVALEALLSSESELRECLRSAGREEAISLAMEIVASRIAGHVE